MRDAQKPDHVSLHALVDRLKEGRFVIPDFQREFEWFPWDIRDLMRSIFLDYYIGSLLLWKGRKENYSALSCEAIYGFGNSKGQQPWQESGRVEHIVLDGQQRLTALHYAFVSPDVPLPNRASRAIYYIRVDKFMNEQYDDAFQYDWYCKRTARMLADRSIQHAEHIFPLSVVGAGGWDLPNWVQDYEKFWENASQQAETDSDDSAAKAARKHAKNAKAFGEHVRGITQDYQIAYIELDENLALDKVCDIFTQINSKGIRLDVFDLINALLKPKGVQLKHMWREAAPRLEFVETGKMNVYVLQVMSMLCQAYCSPKYLYYLLPGQPKQTRDASGELETTVLVPDAVDFESRWQRAVSAIEDAVKMLRHPHDFGVVSSQYLPYVSILPVFSSLQAIRKQLPQNEQLSAQRKIRHWYWASVFTNRYSGAVESTSARDFQDVREWIANSDARPSLIQEFDQRFRSLDLRKEVKKGSSVYNGIFNLLVLLGARDWMTGDIPQYGDLDDHHIVPKSWGGKHLPGGAVHTILNRTPLTADTNRHAISDRLPNEYLPELIKNNGETQVRAILESHLVSPTAFDILLRDPFGPEDYEAFITERQRTIMEAIENLLIKERLDLSAPLRELDEKIERTELALRARIATTLDNDAGQLPQHVNQQLQERIVRAARKNAAMDAENYHALEDRLEFADLRELEQIITSKATWGRFEQLFSNKAAVSVKFDQLAGLRNGIRHSRTVDEISRKEGEAAILWFAQVLGGDRP